MSSHGDGPVDHASENMTPASKPQPLPVCPSSRGRIPAQAEGRANRPVLALVIIASYKEEGRPSARGE